MKFKDYYKIIGVAPEATADEIKTAYRKLARRLHPDVSKEPGAAQRFTEVGEANDALKDPARRAVYDQVRASGWRDGQEMDAPPPPPASSRTRDFDQGEQTSDFFESLFRRQAFGGGGGRAGGGGERSGGREHVHERGQDLTYPLVVSLEESFHGGERQLKLQTPTMDDHGDLVTSNRTINVKIPKGVVQGTKMRLKGQGQTGSGEKGKNGNLFLDIELAAHALYFVAGSDLSLTVPIAPWEAALGAQMAVPTLGGTVTATIPAGAQQGQKLRLKGRGLPSEPPGDQYLILNIVMPPTAASDKAKELYHSLAAEADFNPRAALGV